MSEYNIQMNKYNALNAGYDQLYPATKIENVDGLNTALQNKAPAGYGLGKNFGMSITDGDEAVYGGNYFWGNTTQNLPFNYGCMSVTVRANGSLIQTAYSEAYSGCSAQRKCTDGTFGEWEWVNPPMQLGIEYRTTERYLGKPVYTYAFHFDVMPSANSYANRNAPCKNAEAVIDCRAINNTYGAFYPRRNFVSATDKPLTMFSAWPNGTDYIYVLCTTDSEDYSGQSATVLLKYTKTTD